MPSAIPTATKSALWTALLNGATIKAALHTTAYTGGAASTGWTNSAESSATNYTTGGATVTGQTITTNGTKGIVDYADVTFSNLTGSFGFVVLYIDSDVVTPKRILAVIDVGSQTVTGSNVTIQWPTPDATNAILRIA